ncbi:MAG: glycosyltransferase family 39 protein, partial [Alphaproteobacteria bacterium]|nr:glycosyltransferase family 39 protein [Alphaproteobacteria bacterium]
MFAAVIFWVTLRLGSTLFSDPLVGRLAVLILTVYPNQILYVPLLGTEVFYTALLLTAVAVIVAGQSWPRLVLSGILFGVGTLTKAQTLLLPVILLTVWWVLMRDQLKVFRQIGRVALIYAAMAGVILPWSVRNYWIFGEFVLISTNWGRDATQWQQSQRVGR